MNTNEELDLLFKQNNGILKTSQVLNSGITKPSFYAYMRKRNVDQVAPGIYATSDAWVDQMYLLHLRSKQAVFSHETALFFHDLTDREPRPYEVTVMTGYNPFSLKKDGIKVHTIKKELHDVGIITKKTRLLEIQFLSMIWKERFVISFESKMGLTSKSFEML